MILYLSGNFPQLASPEKEFQMAKDNMDNGIPYHRLMTFYYPKHCTTILNTQRRLYESKQERPKRQTIIIKARSRKEGT